MQQQAFKPNIAMSENLWPEVQIDYSLDIPRLIRKGKPWAGIGVSRTYFPPHWEVYKRLGDIGADIFVFDATCSEDIYHPDMRVWKAPGVYDYKVQEDIFSTLANIRPDALFLPKLYVGSPPWWDENHPEELQVYADGRKEHTFQRTERKTLPSIASELWKASSVDCIQRYINWLMDSGWSRHVFAIFICYGITWEWGILGSDDFLDYSLPMLRYFRSWLLRRYKDDIHMLQDAWGKTVDFETAEIPSQNERNYDDGTDFRDPMHEQAVVDFQQCLSDANVDLLLSLARTVKEDTRGKVLVGAFYGYTLTAREHSPFMGRYGAGGFQGGHHALKRVLDSPYIDILGSPFNYCNRSLGNGLLFEHSPLASIQKHGKLFYEENDLWTFNNPPQFEDRISVGYTSTLEDSVKHQRIAFAQSICRAKNFWWMELTGWIGPFRENFSDPVLLQELQTQINQNKKLITQSRQSVSEIAVIVDEESVSWFRLTSKLFLSIVYEQTLAWAHAGAPFDIFLLSDVNPELMKRYRLIIVALALYLDKEKRLLLERSLKRDGKVIIWGHGSGLLGPRATKNEGMEKLIGIEVMPMYLPPYAKVVGQLSNGEGFCYHCPSAIHPAFIPQDDRAEIIGQLEREALPGLVVKRFPEYTSVYSAVPIQDAKVFAWCAQQAGVHRYVDECCTVWANEFQLVVHVGPSGRRTIHVQWYGRVREIFSNTCFEIQSPTFDWVFEENGVAFFQHLPSKADEGRRN